MGKVQRCLKEAKQTYLLTLIGHLEFRESTFSHKSFKDRKDDYFGHIQDIKL